jgi:hypothetical protein
MLAVTVEAAATAVVEAALALDVDDERAMVE